MSQNNPTQDNPSVALVKKFYECYASGDLQALKNEVVAPDVTWHIPGHHSLAGTKNGVDEVAAFFTALSKANFKAEVLFLGGNDEYVVDCHRGWGESGDAKVDMNWCLLYQIRDGRITHVQNFAGDQHEADRFFNSVYQLKPLPDRLAE